MPELEGLESWLAQAQVDAAVSALPPDYRALLRRAETGLPRVNRLTDVDNAISVLHQVPLGGEDLDCYAGPPRLLRASDDAGVTCRRWNWRQARRTQLSDGTTAALCILDALAPLADQALDAAADHLVTHLTRLRPEVRVARRTLPDSRQR